MRTLSVLRMAAPLVLIGGLLLGLAVFAAWHVHCLQQNAAVALSSNVTSLRAAEEFEIGIREVRNQLDRYLMTRNRKHLEAVPALRRKLDGWLGEADRVATTEFEKQQMGRLQDGYRHFFREYDTITADAAPGELPLHLQELIDNVLNQEILVPAHEYLDFNEVQLTRASAENQQLGDRLVRSLMLLGLCGAGAGLSAGLLLARWVNRSIVQLSLPIRDAAGKLGEVVGPIRLSTAWGWQELENALQGMTGQIGAVIARLRQSEREVLRAEQLAKVGQMAAGMAHELRNPLMSMKLLVQVAADGTPATLDQRDLAVLEEEITRLERLTQTFLDFARPPRPEPQSIDLGELLQQTLDLMAARAEQQEARLACGLPAAPIMVRADPCQVRQVLVNLLLNALDAVPLGGDVEAELAEEAGGWLAIRVNDSGGGLPAELGSRIFEPFVSTKTTGLGLGLSICKRIAEAHGGELQAEDRRDGGAAFTFRLPASLRVAATARQARQPQPTAV
ncbi:MAG: histidine kinase [Planctomycetia bacterium]|nr:histidine kinase [Planctomycetia bacterium]